MAYPPDRPQLLSNFDTVVRETLVERLLTEFGVKGTSLTWQAAQFT